MTDCIMLVCTNISFQDILEIQIQNNKHFCSNWNTNHVNVIKSKGRIVWGNPSSNRATNVRARTYAEVETHIFLSASHLSVYVVFPNGVVQKLPEDLCDLEWVSVQLRWHYLLAFVFILSLQCHPRQPGLLCTAGLENSESSASKVYSSVPCSLI